MSESLEEMVLRVADDTDTYCKNHLGLYSHHARDIEFARRLLAEQQKQEPIGRIHRKELGRSTVGLTVRGMKLPDGTLVYAAPVAKPDTVSVPREIIDRFPEINPSNYDHDDACALNAWGIEVVLVAAERE